MNAAVVDPLWLDRISSAALPAAPPRLVVRVALALRQALLTCAHALVPAEVRLLELAVGVAPTKLLHVVAKHRIADLLADGPRTAPELAERTGLDAGALHRTLRALAHLGVFTLRRDGRFENNRLSATLCDGRRGRLREAAVYLGSAANVAAWNDLEETVRTGRNAFERVFGMSIWEWFDGHPDERETFANFMMGRTAADAPLIASLYPFGEVGRICDVGGGRGTLLSELLIRHPHLRGILCDAPGVIASARALLQRRGVADRVELVAGSFFESVPVGADAYLLKNILHDWDDARSLRILGVVRRAMQPGQRLLVIEWLTERNDSAALGALSDVQMMTVCGDGRERGRLELEQLLRQGGFHVTRVLPSPTVSIVEAVADPN
jgi:DNA-binding transcriptional ArsR family regulator